MLGEGYVSVVDDPDDDLLRRIEKALDNFDQSTIQKPLSQLYADAIRLTELRQRVVLANLNVERRIFQLENRMRVVRGDELKKAALARNIKVVAMHNCSFCGYGVSYLISDGDLYLDKGCHCVVNPPGPQAVGWEHAAHWVNMQSKADKAKEIAAQFGFELVE